MADLAGRWLTTRRWRVDRAVTAVQTRFALLFPDGESLDAGRAIWTLSSTPLLVANGVVRYDATDFHGPDSERDLDNCLAVLSTYDVPWRFSAWEHLGADLLVPQLVARGMTGTSIAEAMWLDLGGRPELCADDERIDVRPAKTLRITMRGPRSSVADRPTHSWKPSNAERARALSRMVAAQGRQRESRIYGLALGPALH
jgi:hypothetical protein